MKKDTKPKKCIVTDVHRDQFVACVEYWADVLGLADWRINVSELRSSRAVMAEVIKIDLEQRSATIRLGKDFNFTPVNERSLSELALHECLHIMLHEMLQFAAGESVQTDIDSAEHRVINVLERVLSAASPLGPKS